MTQVRIGLACAALIATATLGLSRPVRAGDAVDLQRQDQWQVGDVVTTVVKEQIDQSFTLPAAADGSDPSPPPHKILVDAKLIEKCLAVDAKGRRTSSAVYVESFVAEDGPKKESTLAGAVLVVSGLGKDRAARVASSKQELSKTASAWLGRRYGGGRPDPETARGYWLPKAPVSVGDTWSADLAAFSDATPAGTLIAKEKSTSACSLASVSKGYATVNCESSLALASFPAKEKGAPIPWTSGGVQLVKGVITMGLEGRVASSSLAFTSSLEGGATLGGKPVAFSYKTRRSVEEQVAGEWPTGVTLPAVAAPSEPAAPDDPKPPAPAAPTGAPSAAPPTGPVPEPGMGGMGG